MMQPPRSSLAISLLRPSYLGSIFRMPENEDAMPSSPSSSEGLFSDPDSEQTSELELSIASEVSDIYPSSNMGKTTKAQLPLQVAPSQVVSTQSRIEAEDEELSNNKGHKESQLDEGRRICIHGPLTISRELTNGVEVE